MNLTVLIFSKNRACQLELLLRSLDIKVKQKSVRVLYTCDPEYQAAYEKLKKLYPDVVFMPESDFRRQVIESITDDYLLFETDDDVMIDSFSEDCPEFRKFESNEDIMCLNLRMSRNYDYDFLKDRQVSIPEFDDGTWEWRKYRHDWGYPWNTSAHIFRKKDLLPVLETSEFSSPHSLEFSMRRWQDKPLMIGFEKAKFIDIPVNAVSQNNQRIGNVVSTDFLNDKFMEGYRLALEPVIEAAKTTRSYFMPLDYEWTKQ